jgi:hypothetical protein
MGKKIYDWSIISADYTAGLGYRDLHKKYGISAGAIAKARKRGDIESRTISEGLKVHFENNPKELSDFGTHRICKCCNQNKEIQDFRIANRGRQNYYRWMCISCERIILDERKNQYKEEYLNYKKTLSCNRCGNNNHRVLQFHHTNTNKEFNISSKVGRRTLLSLMKEIDKCEVLCANCHSIEHYEQRNEI